MLLTKILLFTFNWTFNWLIYTLTVTLFKSSSSQIDQINHEHSRSGLSQVWVHFYVKMCIVFVSLLNWGKRSYKIHIFVCSHLFYKFNDHAFISSFQFCIYTHF